MHLKGRVKLCVFLSLIFLFNSIILNAEYYEGSAITFDSCYLADADWGDYDNDGDLDLLFAGYQSTGAPVASSIVKLYKNLGNNAFVEVNTPFLGSGTSSLAFCDINNDGLLDVYIQGQTGFGIRQSKLYINNGNDLFTMSEQVFPGIGSGSCDFGDYDQDGLKDLLVTGQDTSNVVYTSIYKNAGNGSFLLMETNLPAVNNGSAIWGDYDNDGDLDIALSGSQNSTYITKIYKNNGNNTFTALTGTFTGVRYSAMRWGDMDADGDLDLFVTGSNNNNTPSIFKIYRNDGNDNFAVVSPTIPAARQGDLNLGDINNDGYLDLFMGGLITTTLYTGCTYLYNPSTQQYAFSDSLIEAKYATFALADINNDGDLDVHFTGRDGDTFYNQMFVNTNTVPNTAPAILTGLSSIVSENQVILSWNQGVDAQTPSTGLTYNLYVGTSPSTMNIVCAEADLSSGFRKVVRMGNMGCKTSFTLKNLASGTYYWSIQAVDNNFAGSVFAPEQSFIINDENNVCQTPVITPNGGNFTEPQLVSLSCGTPGSSIHFTIDGTMPDVNSPIYTSPLTINSTMILKALATAQNLLPSAVASATFNFPVFCANLAELRNQPANNTTIYKLTSEAIVTAKHNYRNQKFIQDSSAGIMLDDLNNTLNLNINIGDGLTGIIGRLTTFDGMLQFIPVFNLSSVSSTGNTLTPQTITIQELYNSFSQYESELIRIINTNFTINGVFNFNQNYLVYDQSDSCFFRTILQDTDYQGTTIPSLPQTITGIATKSSSQTGFTARSLNDFSITFPSPSTLTGQVVNSSIVLNWSIPVSSNPQLTGFNIYKNGQLINNTPLSPTTSSYTDNTITLNQAYSYYLTALYLNPQGISVPSNTILIQYGDALLPPLNLTAQPDHNNVALSWAEPGSIEPTWIHWDNGNHSFNIGTSEASAEEFIAAVRFLPENIEQYNQMYLTKVKFWPHAPNCLYTLKVWQGGSQTNAGTLIYEQQANNIAIDSWNEIILSTPVQINSAQELWFGIHYSTSAGFPAGADEGPALNYQGNMMYWDGQWTTLYNLSSQRNYNWNLQGYLSGVQRNRSLTGYNIYRNDVLLNNSPVNDTNFSDIVPGAGNYSYYTKAVYTGNVLSPASNIVSVNITGNEDNNDIVYQNKLYANYPNPFNPETTISFSLKESQFVIVKIYNIKGELVKTMNNSYCSKGLHKLIWRGINEQNQSVSSGIYFCRIECPSFRSQIKMLLIK